MTKEKILVGALIGTLFVIILSIPVQPFDFSQFSGKFEAQVSGAQASNATFTFSHNNGVLIAGEDSWTMSLNGGNRRDRLQVKAWKDNVPVNNGRYLNICTIGWWGSQGCSRTGRPTQRDTGSWREVVYINGIEKGTITFVVRLPTPSIIPPRTTSDARFIFSHNNRTLTAGRDAWKFDLVNGKPGDTLEVGGVKVDAANNRTFLGRVTICTVVSYGSAPIQPSTCSFSAIPTTADIGRWTETVFINGIQQPQIVSFTVVAPGTLIPLW